MDIWTRMNQFLKLGQIGIGLFLMYKSVISVDSYRSIPQWAIAVFMVIEGIQGLYGISNSGNDIDEDMMNRIFKARLDALAAIQDLMEIERQKNEACLQGSSEHLRFRGESSNMSSYFPDSFEEMDVLLSCLEMNDSEMLQTIWPYIQALKALRTTDQNETNNGANDALDGKSIATAKNKDFETESKKVQHMKAEKSGASKNVGSSDANYKLAEEGRNERTESKVTDILKTKNESVNTLNAKSKETEKINTSKTKFEEKEIRCYEKSDTIETKFEGTEKGATLETKSEGTEKGDTLETKYEGTEKGDTLETKSEGTEKEENMETKPKRTKTVDTLNANFQQIKNNTSKKMFKLIEKCDSSEAKSDDVQRGKLEDVPKDESEKFQKRESKDVQKVESEDEQKGGSEVVQKESKDIQKGDSDDVHKGGSEDEDEDVNKEHSDDVQKVESKDVQKVESEDVQKVESEDVQKVESEDVQKVESEDVQKVESEDVQKVESEDVQKVESEDVQKEESEDVQKEESEDIQNGEA